MSLLAARVRALEALFRDIERARLADVPLLHRALRVEAVGFEPEDDARRAVGVLLTPWFMNLVRMPLREEAGEPGVGAVREHAVGTTRFEFIAAFEPGFGTYEACSLVSPMFDFADQAQARATAAAVLAALRRPPERVCGARRGFLLGRGEARA